VFLFFSDDLEKIEQELGTSGIVKNLLIDLRDLNAEQIKTKLRRLNNIKFSQVNICYICSSLYC
jgi:hypothetical protein